MKFHEMIIIHWNCADYIIFFFSFCYHTQHNHFFFSLQNTTHFVYLFEQVVLSRTRFHTNIITARLFTRETKTVLNHFLLLLNLNWNKHKLKKNMIWCREGWMRGASCQIWSQTQMALEPYTLINMAKIDVINNWHGRQHT